MKLNRFRSGRGKRKNASSTDKSPLSHKRKRKSRDSAAGGLSSRGRGKGRGRSGPAVTEGGRGRPVGSGRAEDPEEAVSEPTMQASEHIQFWEFCLAIFLFIVVRIEAKWTWVVT